MANRFLATVAAITLTVGFVLPAQAPAASATVTQDQVVRDVIDALQVIENNYVDDVDAERMTKAAITGMLRTLDPHSMFYDEKEFEAFRTEQQSQYFGTGVTIGERNGKVYVLAPFADTPADRAGLRYGDEIVEIDGQSTAKFGLPKVSEMMRGPLGTKVKVKLARPGTAQPIAVEIARDAIPLPTVINAYMVAPGVGYIHLQRGWNFTTSQEVAQALDRLKKEGMKSLVFDLRDNPGGLVREAISVANNFLFKGQTILSIRGRAESGQRRDFAASNGQPDVLPMVMLINGNTASASEIFAGALQDHDRALIVGETSFGKGLVQSPYELDKNRGGLILTTQKYYTPSGRLIQRDYSNTSIYDYYMHRNRESLDEKPRDTKQAYQTDTGRSIFGGGGISPDVAQALSNAETNKKLARWLTPLFMFTRESINGQTAGFEQFRVQRLTPGHRVLPTDMVVSDAYIAQFKKFVTANPSLKVTAADVDAEREFLRQHLRRELATAHYGLETALQVSALKDVQIQRAIKEMPQAERMADGFRRRNLAAAGRPAVASGITVRLAVSPITRRRFLHTAGAALAAVPVVCSVPAALAAAPRFSFARLRYGSGNWDTDGKMPSNVLNSIVEYTSIRVDPDERVVALDSDELFAFPFAYLSGNELVRFTAREREHLGRYVHSGGFLFVDDCNHDVDGVFARSFEAEMGRLFPGRASLGKIPNTHPLYRAFFDFEDGPPPTSHELNGWGDDMVHDYLKAVEIDGRIGVLYSNKDYGCEWNYDFTNKRFSATDNTKFGVNIVVYALTH